MYLDMGMDFRGSIKDPSREHHQHNWDSFSLSMGSLMLS